MRRTFGIVFAALGVVALLGALIIKVWVEPNAVKLPTDSTAQSVAEGTGSGLNLQTAQPFKDVPLVATRHLTSDEKASDDDNVVWDMHVKLVDPTGNALTDYVDRIAVDRDNAEAVNKAKYKEKIEDARVGTRLVKHEGLSYHFPFNTEKKTYKFWDANTGKAFDAKYDKEEKLKGVTTYKFTQQVPATKIREVTLPGAALGLPVASATLDVYYTNARSVWVEPTSGWIVKGSEDAKTTLRMPGSGEDAAVVLANKLTFNDDTVEKLTDRAKDDRQDIQLVQTKLPWAGLIGGAILLLLGLLFLMTGKKGRHAA